MPTTSRHRTMAEAALEELREAIILGELVPGAPLRLGRPAWDSCERYRPALLSPKGDLQDRHERLDAELLAACEAHDEDRAAAALRAHLELAGEFYAVELGDRGIFDR